MVDSKEEYAPLAAEDGSESESSYQEYRLRSLEPRTPFYRRSSTWAILITIVVAFAAGAVSGWSMKRESGAQVYRTDFAEARGAIDLEEVEFTGTALFDDDDGHAYVKPQEVSYVGKPSKEIDNAWHNLIDRRYTWITDEEAEAAWGPNYTQYWRKPGFGYRAGFDVLHTLHCVDVLRKVIYKDHYAKHPDVHHGHHPSKENDKGSHREKRKIAGFKQYHIDHCLDIVRQSIQCQGDMTLIPTRWFPGIDRNFIDSDQVHTCRNFDKLREWATERWWASYKGWYPEELDEKTRKALDEGRYDSNEEEHHH